MYVRMCVRMCFGKSCVACLVKSFSVCTCVCIYESLSVYIYIYICCIYTDDVCINVCIYVLNVHGLKPDCLFVHQATGEWTLVGDTRSTGITRQELAAQDGQIRASGGSMGAAKVC
jgi:hypothetical protein